MPRFIQRLQANGEPRRSNAWRIITNGNAQCGIQQYQSYTLDYDTPITVSVTSLRDVACLRAVPTTQAHPNVPQGSTFADRYWTITAVDANRNDVGSGFSVTLTLQYDQADARSRLCRWDGSAWDCGDGTDTTFVANTSVTRSGITQFSDWAVGQNVGPTAVTLQTVSAASPAPLALLRGGLLALLALTTTLLVRRQRP